MGSITFSDLLAPMTVSEFQEKYWSRGAVLLPPRPSRFEGLAFDLDLLVERMRQASPDLAAKAQFFDKHGQHREMRIQASQIKGCFAAGMTICIGNTEKFLPDLDAQAQACRDSINFGGEFGFSCYWSPDNAGFGTHYDDRPVFICQLQGSKRWWYSSTPAITAPQGNWLYRAKDLPLMRAHGFEISEPIEAEFEQATLLPGDMLYLPAGTWHKTSAVGESLALTIRMRENNPALIMRDVLRQLFKSESDWRQPLPLFERTGVSANEPDEQTMAVFRAQLESVKTFVAGLTVDDFAAAWKQGQRKTKGGKDAPEMSLQA
jgi:ribosomal protein L16 Arg81 hydroxylase